MKNYKVYYGVDKLNKIAKKPAMSVVFLNDEDRTGKLLYRVNQRMHVVYERIQTDEEMMFVKEINNSFTTYRTFIYEKPFKGDIEAILSNNFYADENHVSIEERELIKSKLRIKLNKIYPTKSAIPYQSQILF